MKRFGTELPDPPTKRSDYPAWGDAVRDAIQKNWVDAPCRWDFALIQLHGTNRRRDLSDLATEVLDAAEGMVVGKLHTLNGVAVRMTPDVEQSRLELIQH